MGLAVLPLLLAACSSGGDGLPGMPRADATASAVHSPGGGAGDAGRTPESGAPAPVGVVRVAVVGSQWQWAFNYQEGPANRAGAVYDVGTPGNTPTLYLPQGGNVRFELTSLDVIHAFWVPSFLLKVDVLPDRMTVAEIVPTTLGEFDGQCAELCGADHNRMRLRTKVVTAEEYQRHLEELKTKGQTGAVSNCRDAGRC
ncbi:hypothetical protein [Embleya sp. MST-111070]|uniref:hypothetical protein n=1 Tax=Embleya sp. MST-111070 TaxID=3398231 RepID=UPI003F73F9B6